MGTDAVEKPTVVRNNHGTTREIIKTFLERSERVDV